MSYWWGQAIQQKVNLKVLQIAKKYVITTSIGLMSCIDHKKMFLYMIMVYKNS